MYQTDRIPFAEALRRAENDSRALERLHAAGNGACGLLPGKRENGTSAAYLFSGCTSLKTVPEDMFRHFEGTTIISEMFLNCTSLESLPVTISTA